MRILVIGGSGFLGYHIVSQLIKQHHVSLFCRNKEKTAEIFKDQVDYISGDLTFFRDINFTQTFKDIDIVIYAAGIDERTETNGDPYTFFYRENVNTCINFIEKAKQHGVKHAIVLGSIFTFLNQEHPQLQLSTHHPYIRSRTQQREYALALADNTFQVNIAEIPFVFGDSPHSPPIAKRLINYIRIATPLLSITGGANAISVNSLAQAIVGIINHVDDSCAIPIGDQNLSWIELMQTISELVNEKPKPITLLQSTLLTDLTHLGAFLQDMIGVQSGLSQHHISDIITLEGFFDSSPIKQRLHYKGGDLQQALIDTVNAQPESLLITNVQRSVNWVSDNTRNLLKNIDWRANDIPKK